MCSELDCAAFLGCCLFILLSREKGDKPKKILLLQYQDSRACCVTTQKLVERCENKAAGSEVISSGQGRRILIGKEQFLSE